MRAGSLYTHEHGEVYRVLTGRHRVRVALALWSEEERRQPGRQAEERKAAAARPKLLLIRTVFNTVYCALL